MIAIMAIFIAAWTAVFGMLFWAYWDPDQFLARFPLFCLVIGIAAGTGIQLLWMCALDKVKP